MLCQKLNLGVIFPPFRIQNDSNEQMSRGVEKKQMTRSMRRLHREVEEARDDSVE